MSSLNFSTQTEIVVTTMTFLNHIKKYAIEDEWFNKCDQDPNCMPQVEGDHEEQQSS